MNLIKRFLLWLVSDENEVNYILSSEILPKPLTHEEEEYYLNLYENGDKEAKNTLLEHNLRLVVYIAKRYENNPNNMEDLISIGTFGLIKAIETFKRDKNIKLVTYASRCIENEILMFLRKKNKRKVEVSFDEPLNVDYDGNELVLADILGTEGDIVKEEFEKNEQIRILNEAIKNLKKREQEILKMRYGIDQEELTQKDVATKLGISQSYISRLEKRILLKLKMVIERQI